MRLKSLASAAVTLFIGVAARAHGEAPQDPLVGLWGSEGLYGPAVRGQLTVDGRGQAWRATIAGFDVVARHQGNAVSFSLPNDQGEFRGELDADAAHMVGQWIQPPGRVYFSRFATPVALLRSGDGVWQGAVTPLDNRLSAYLLISQAADGTLSAFVRNPDFNLGRNAPYRVVRDGDRVTLIGTRSGDRIDGSYDKAGNRLLMRLRIPNSTLEFTPRGRNDAVGFYPETPPQDKIGYVQPVSEEDGWATASLQQTGLAPDPLLALVDTIVNTPYAGFKTPYLHSLLIARHGKLVLERYFHGYSRDRTHTTRSAGKTFAGVLTGIALDRGAKFGLDTPVVSLFPEYRDIARLDPRKRRITVQNLLTFTSGLACNDDDDGSPGNEDRMQDQDAQPDWYKYTLDLPMAADPGGSKAVYCSAAVNLLGGVVSNATDMPLLEFFYRYYAAPLDIRLYHVNLMPTGQAYLGGGIEMRPRDQLKLGQLYLNGGGWNGRRVISQAWVDASWRRYSSFASDHGYGFNWHIIDVTSGGHSYRLYEAGGNGGQFVIAIPELDMVVGFTAGNYGDFATWYRFMTEWIPKFIIPAAVPPAEATGAAHGR
ncbi:MAG: beta-lactamase family protein [Acidobacteriia bacterium]|nr:beta-lactamase family protein [Terriglobia bacterium]